MFFAQSWYFTNQILGIYLMECKITIYIQIPFHFNIKIKKKNHEEKDMMDEMLKEKLIHFMRFSQRINADYN